MTTNNTVYVTRQFNCSKNTLFKWIAEPSLISKWFGPKHLSVSNVKSDFKVGGHYEIELLKPDATRFTIGGTYLEIDQPNQLTFSFIYSGLPKLPPDSTVQISLKEISSFATELALIQKFETIASDMENRTRAWKNMFQKLTDAIKTVPDHV